jgi:TolB protein
MNGDGSNPQQVTFHGSNIQDWWAVWSPDSSRMAFTRYDHTNFKGRRVLQSIYTMSSDGTNLVRLTDPQAQDNNLADYSPDGRKIAFATDRSDPDPATNCQFLGLGVPGCNWDIYVMNADGSDVRQLTSDPGVDTYPEFSPDGRKILFASTRS